MNKPNPPVMYQKKMLPFLTAILLVFTFMSLPTISFAQSDKEKLDLIKSMFSIPDDIKKENSKDYITHELSREDTVAIKTCIDLYKTSMKKHGFRDLTNSNSVLNFRAIIKHAQITHEEDFFGDSLLTWMQKMASHKNENTIVKIKIIFGTYSQTFLETRVRNRTNISTSELKRIMDKKGRTTAILVAYAYKPKTNKGNLKSEEDPLDGFLGGYDLGEIHPPY
jgi:hypothetical protein